MKPEADHKEDIVYKSSYIKTLKGYSFKAINTLSTLENIVVVTALIDGFLLSRYFFVFPGPPTEVTMQLGLAA